MTRRAFVAFAGGGAKALTHIGALRAMEQRKVKFLGLSGTSAGALVATLAAAGMSSAEMMDPATRRTLIDGLGDIDPAIRRTTDLFGPVGWRRIVRLRTSIRRLPLILGLVVLAPLIAVFAVGWHVAPQNLLLALGALACILVWLVAATANALSGMANATRLRDALQELLRRRMFPAEPGRIVRMSDFGAEGRPTLKIVSANLSRHRLHLISPERTPEMATADAVVASIALPIVFEPHFIDGDLHMDGGIVSNLPAWPFDEERELDPDALTIAVEVGEAAKPAVLGSFNWPPSFLRTALFGAGELNLRASGAAERLILHSSLELLDFDMTADRAFQEVEDAEKAASVRLDSRLFRRPELYVDACKVTKALVEDVLSSVIASPGSVRVAVAIMDPGYTRSVRLRYAVGYEDYPDEAMLLPIEGSIVGAAWKERESRLELMPFPEELFLPGPANRVRRRLMRQDLEWVFAIPILDASKQSTRLVVQIDGSRKLPQSAKVDLAVTEIEDGVKDFFVLIADRLDDLENGNGLE
jgi:NTE family protein